MDIVWDKEFKLVNYILDYILDWMFKVKIKKIGVLSY